jgi:integrase
VHAGPHDDFAYAAADRSGHARAGLCLGTGLAGRSRIVAEQADRHRRDHELDIALGTGVRKSEQYRITWDKVNFNRKEIVIPKTKFGPARTVHIIPAVERALKALKKLPLTPREWKKGMPSKVPLQCVFAIHENRTWFTSAVKRAKLKDVHWHVLRHTFISRLVQKGVNLKVVQVAAGHRTIAMTARYAHLDKSALVNAMALLDWEPSPLSTS